MKNAIKTAAIASSIAASAPAFAQVDITAAGPEGDLAGTMIAPEDGRPVVLMIPGSGPTDRDGNNPLGVASASYRLLAEALATDGIGSVRIDKRGMFGSAGASADANDVTIGAYAEDVHSWVTATRAATGVECVWVLGHSEGGLVALKAAQEPGDICGLILVASMGRKAGDIMREQLSGNPVNAPILEEALAAIDTLENGGTVDAANMHPALAGLFAPQVQGFLADMMAHDPAELAAATDLPMLIVSGTKDIQTPVTDGNTLSAARSDALHVVIEDMNHALKLVAEDTRAANLAAYARPDLPVAQELVTAVAAFVTGDED